MKPSFTVRILAAALVILGLACHGRAQSREQPPTPNSRDRIFCIIIRGNQRIPALDIRKMIPINPGDVYDPGKVEASAAALKRSGMFDDVWTRVSDGPDGARGGTVVVFGVHEKQTK